jgi:hypothetical protein
VDIIAAVFADDIQLRPVPGPATRIDLTGIQFSAPAPGPVPVTVGPHLMVLVWCPPEEQGFGALEVVFRREGVEEPVARNVQPLQIEPGKFNYRLVRAEIPFDSYDTVIAECRIDAGSVSRVPYTLLPPVE